MGLIYTEGRDAFERMLASQSAHLRDANYRFIRGMCEADRTVLLSAAIECAWEHRNEFKPRPGFGLPQFWERCLRNAARSREKWRIAVAVLPGVYEWRWVLGTRLGR